MYDNYDWYFFLYWVEFNAQCSLLIIVVLRVKV